MQVTAQPVKTTAQRVAEQNCVKALSMLSSASSPFTKSFSASFLLAGALSGRRT